MWPLSSLYYKIYNVPSSSPNGRDHCGLYPNCGLYYSVPPRQIGLMAESSVRPFSQVVRTPGDFLKQAIGQQVYVKLHSGTEYHGTTEWGPLHMGSLCIVVFILGRGDRKADLSGWLHEHCLGTGRRVDRRHPAPDLRRCLYPRQQRYRPLPPKPRLIILSSPVHSGAVALASTSYPYPR